MKNQKTMPAAMLAKTAAILAASLFVTLGVSNASKSMASTHMVKTVQASHSSHRMLEQMEQNSSYADAAHQAMMERNASGDFGEVYADFTE